MRAANPQARREALTSRPLLLAAVGRTVSQGRQTTLYLTPMHTEAGLIKAMIANPDGDLKFPHLWPVSTPPPPDASAARIRCSFSKGLFGKRSASGRRHLRGEVGKSRTPQGPSTGSSCGRVTCPLRTGPGGGVQGGHKWRNRGGHPGQRPSGHPACQRSCGAVAQARSLASAAGLHLPANRRPNGTSHTTAGPRGAPITAGFRIIPTSRCSPTRPKTTNCWSNK